MKDVEKNSFVCQYYIPEVGRAVNLWSLVADEEEFFADVQGTSLKVVKGYLEAALEARRDKLVLAGRHERSGERSDSRNGYYWRKALMTAIGVIKGLRVPRCRKRSLIADVRERLDGLKGAVESKVVEMFLKGLSVRSIGPVLDGLLGLSISPGQVSRLAGRWDGLVRSFHDGALFDKYVYLFFDGIHLKRRAHPRLFRTPAQARHRVVLVAYGVTERGVKELIGYRLEASESEAAWRRFLGGLVRRGLTGQRVRLIVTDGGKGLLMLLCQLREI
jgi:transposase-like protein